MKLLVITGICTVLLGCICSVHTSARLQAEEIEELLFAQFSDYDPHVNQLLMNLTGLGEMLNGSSLVDQLAKSISHKLAQVESLLNESIQVATDLYHNRFVSPCCMCLNNGNGNDCESVCNTTFYQPIASSNESDTSSIDVLQLQYSELFGRNVSFEESAVHVPGDIYHKDTKLICFIDWTRNLTEHFANQKNENTPEDGITYQYFGGTFGALLFYPGTLWSDLNHCSRCPLRPVDTYHATERPWYSRTIPGSKLVAIVLDLSGSMSGFRLLLAKLAAVRLLETLSPHDYFYVIGNQFGKTIAVQPLECSNHITRASPENVLAMNEIIMRLNNTDLMGSVDFTRALELVFKRFNSSSVSTCHNLTVVFTDNFSDKNQLKIALQTFNYKKKVRVFIFLVGPPVDGNQLLTEIACQNGGDFYQLQYYNDVQEGVANFSNRIRSQLFNQSFRPVYWTQYKDVFGNYVLSGSAPLIVDNQQFLGVMGVDINLSWLEENFMQHHAVTARYHTFMIDHLGELLFHPQINREFISNTSVDDILKLDLRWFEHAVNSSEFEVVRRSMLNGESGQYTLNVWTSIKRQKRYVKRNVTYYYAPVTGSLFNFSVAVAIIGNHSQDILLLNSTEIELMLQNYLMEFDQNSFFDLYNGVKVGAATSYHWTIPQQTFEVFVETESERIIVRRIYANTTSVVVGTVYINDSLLHVNLSTIISNNSTDETVILLDANGYVVAASMDLPLGANFFTLNPSMRSDLVAVGLFAEDMIVGYELQPCRNLWPFSDTCEYTGCVDNAGTSVYKGIIVRLFNWIISLITDGTWSALLSVMVSVQTLMELVTAQDCNTTLTGMMMMSQELNSSETACPVDLCLSQFRTLELQDSYSHINGSVACLAHQNETLFYEAVRVPNTNLLLLSINGSCFSQEPKTVYRISCPCDRSIEDSVPLFNMQCIGLTEPQGMDCSSDSERLFYNPFSVIGLIFLCLFLV